MKEDETEDFAAMLAEFEKQAPARRRRDPQVGERVKGRVVSIGQDAAFLDLGAKSEGMIELDELLDENGRLTVRVGDELEGRVVDTGAQTGCILLRRAIGRGADARGELAQAHQLGIPVEGLVIGVNKGGVDVQIAGVRAFCPISQLDQKHVEDPNRFVGQRLAFRVTRYEPASRGRDPNIVLSRRAILEEEARRQAEATRARLAVGAVLSGTVTTVRDFGAFVDLGGIEGMLHVSELGFGRVASARDILHVGQQVEVQVIGIEKTSDPRRPEKVSLSLKALAKDPWEGIEGRYAEGMRLSGTVVRVESYGAFVEIEPGVEGLVHVSELGAARRIRHAREQVAPGDPVEVTVLAVDRERRRLSLSMMNSGGGHDEEAAPPPSPAPSFGTLGDLLRKKK